MFLLVKAQYDQYGKNMTFLTVFFVGGGPPLLTPTGSLLTPQPEMTTDPNGSLLTPKTEMTTDPKESLLTPQTEMTTDPKCHY